MTGTVYLEDVQTARVAASKEDNGPSSSPAEPGSVTKPATEGTTTAKRQRTLMDMFPGSQGSQGKTTLGEPSAKKLKLTASGSTSSLMSTNGSKIFGLQKLNSIPFSMSSFLESLTENQKGLLRLECEVMGKSWLKVLKDEIKKPYFIALKEFLWEEGVRGPDDTSPKLRIYPAPRNIYAWSNTPLGKVKVVILGQDPYHGPGQAHGLCFSVPVGVSVPPSLRNIYTELKAEYPDFQAPKHGNLSAWAANGVLMLNTCLTVRAGDPGSHSNKGWEEFTDRVVDVVDKYGGANLPTAGSSSDTTGTGRGVVFLAWGAWAGKRVAKLTNGNHLILKSAHPSPHSADRGFHGNNHFIRANEWLETKYGAAGKVDWCNLDVKEEL
ncbi:uracil-DNA glycosylase-like protein [Lyophyllum atratum]|nr:uracil-DNA glycosylase-like protein [Lyophyllum atratum]